MSGILSGVPQEKGKKRTAETTPVELKEELKAEDTPQEVMNKAITERLNRRNYPSPEARNAAINKLSTDDKEELDLKDFW